MRNLVWSIVPIAVFAFASVSVAASEPALIGYWKLRGDCKDYSGNGNHGVNHGVNLETDEFNGRNAYIEVPDAPSLKFADGDLTLLADVYTEKGIDDSFGDILSK